MKLLMLVFDIRDSLHMWQEIVNIFNCDILPSLMTINIIDNQIFIICTNTAVAIE